MVRNEKDLFFGIMIPAAIILIVPGVLMLIFGLSSPVPTLTSALLILAWMSGLLISIVVAERKKRQQQNNPAPKRTAL